MWRGITALWCYMTRCLRNCCATRTSLPQPVFRNRPVIAATRILFYFICILYNMLIWFGYFFVDETSDIRKLFYRTTRWQHVVHDKNYIIHFVKPRIPVLRPREGCVSVMFVTR